ncbi:hypothetical protein COO91_00102 [Nostoc flagelliforme CCNUN1]|uniref:Uncharacterized protein n=1 Tax=Nostoc flagelliforme CCNUN1 TaxID=2038116 RepID=A0A2K8SFS2_9NOSO|nr:hypothetical protein [Nostoc flagelliforme]AUB34286.1 hypothetical protein COO91_00102 [Nostoc flagelliforme CCNUN1]
MTSATFVLVTAQMESKPLKQEHWEPNLVGMQGKDLEGLTRVNQ